MFLNFKDKHIKGAKFLNIQTFEDNNSNFKHTIPTQEDFVARMERLNIGITDTVICYENSPN